MNPLYLTHFFRKFNSLSFLLLLGRVLAEPEMMVPSRAPVHGASHRPGLVGSNGNHHDNAIAFPRGQASRQAENPEKKTRCLILAITSAHWMAIPQQGLK